MFAMYDDDGLNFRTTIDHLYNIHEIAKLQKVKNRTNYDDLDRQNHNQTLYKGKITKEATQKYKQISNLDTKVEIYHVEQIMSKKVLTVTDDKTISYCYEIMKHYEVQQLPVVTDIDHQLKGIITRHDILKYMVENIDDIQEKFQTDIKQIATKKIITTDPISDIRRVAKVMLDFNLNAIPVVNSDDQLVGIVSRNDILKAVSTLPHFQMWA